MNRILTEDFEYISKCNICFNSLKNKTILITGATGFLGSLFVKSLLFCDKKLRLNLTIIAVVRNNEKVLNIYNEYIENDNLKFCYLDLLYDEFRIEEKVDFIIHAASVTNSKTMISMPVDVINTAVVGTNKVLDFAVKGKVKSMVYISSMEVYGQINKDEKTTENELGFVDLSNVRSCYPESKRMCECMCAAYSLQYGLNVKSARLAQTFGAGILENENRVFAQFARSVIEKKNIILHTEGKSEGNYVYTRDAITAILLILLNGNRGEAYNIANEESHTTIKDMAEMLAKDVADDRISVKIDVPPESMGYAPDTKLFLSSEKLQKLGWRPSVSLEESYNRMIEYMKSLIPYK